MTTNRPFADDRERPEFGPDFPQAIKGLLAECTAELQAVNALSPLTLEQMKGKGGFQTDAWKIRYKQEGRYSDEFLERRADLVRYIRRIERIRKDWRKIAYRDRIEFLEGEPLAQRKQELAWWAEGETDWEKLMALQYRLRELDPTNIDRSGGRSDDCAPDNISDALAQGIGISEYL